MDIYNKLESSLRIQLFINFISFSSMPQSVTKDTVNYYPQSEGITLM